jgi:hypothetical protein
MLSNEGTVRRLIKILSVIDEAVRPLDCSKSIFCPGSAFNSSARMRAKAAISTLASSGACGTDFSGRFFLQALANMPALAASVDEIA